MVVSISTESTASCFRKKHTDVAESLRLVVAVVVLEALVLLGAVVPRQLEQALALGREAVGRHALVAWVAQEVQVEAGGLLLDLAE